MKNILFPAIFLATICLISVEAVKRTRETPTNAPSSNLNTGSLSDVILDTHLSAVSDPSLHSTTLSNQNARGNPTGRVVQVTPTEPPVISLTAQEVKMEYPWITNPQAISDVLDLESGDIIGPEVENVAPSSKIPSGQKPPTGDGKTRFNNPKYLSDQLEGLNRDEYDFEVTQGVPTSNGVYKVKLNQRWRRLRVYETSLVLEQESDSNMILESRCGEFLSAIEDDISSEIPALSEQAAFHLALAHNMDLDNTIENPSTELIVDTIGETAVLTYIINYYVPATAAASQPVQSTPRSSNKNYDCIRQCRESGSRRNCVKACKPPSAAATSQAPAAAAADVTRHLSRPGADNEGKRPWVLVNANTGVIYKSWDGLASMLRPSAVYLLAGNPLYSVQEYREIMYRNTETDDCYYKKPIGGGMYLRVNDKTGNSKTEGHKFRCADAALSTYDPTNGAASPRNAAYKWGGEVINYIKTASSTNWKFDMYLETHHDGTRAAWNGKSVQLGDGDHYFYPMTTPDTVAHEIGHAFTEYNSNLQYYSHAGSISEAYSDMVATAFIDSFFNYSGDAKYHIGHMGVKLLKPHRDLCNPGSDKLLFYDPKNPIIVTALDYTAQTGLHNGSSLYSKAFCVLSKTAGWDIQLAFKVFTAANSVYWTPKETFNSGVCGVRKAAFDLRNTEQSMVDVDRAFAVVDIACDETGGANV